MREAKIEEMGITIGGQLVSNLSYADDTAPCVSSQEEAETLIGKVNTIGKARLLILHVKKTKLLKVGKMQSDAGVTVGNEHIEVVEHFKYIGSLKAADGNCSKDTRSRIGMVNKRMLDLVPIWKDTGINRDLKMKLVRSLLCTVLTYGAEGLTLIKADEKRIESAQLWIYRRVLRVRWTEHRTDESIRTYFGHTIRDGGCELVKCVIQGKVSGKRKRGRPNTSYNSDVGFLILRRPRPRRGFRGECCQLYNTGCVNSRTQDEYLWTLMAVRRQNSKPVTQRVMRSLARTGDNEGCVLVNRDTLARGTSGDATRCQWRRCPRYPVNDDGQGTCCLCLKLKL